MIFFLSGLHDSDIEEVPSIQTEDVIASYYNEYYLRPHPPSPSLFTR